jgi:hypothetical protein
MERARGFTIHQFVIRVGDWGGYMVFETDNLADIHFLSTALAGFTFQLEPVIDVMDAVGVELLAMEWRDCRVGGLPSCGGRIPMRPP